MELNNDIKTILETIIRKIDLKKADVKLAWKLAHDPMVRETMVEKPYESVLGIELIGSDGTEEGEMFKAAMILAIMFIGREREIKKSLPKPIEGMTAEEFVNSCIRGGKKVIIV